MTRHGFATPSKIPFTPRAVMERAATNVSDPDENGCINSLYSVGSHGYAQVGWQLPDGRTAGRVAHRAVWELVHGIIPVGMVIDHTCHNRRCVNPDHLRMLTNYENARRTSGRDWPLGECINGHPDSELYQQRSGKWVCRPCSRKWRNDYIERHATKETP